jgi:hypothetical protein
MHSRSSNLQSVWIVLPSLTELYPFIGSIFTSSTGDPTFPDSLFLVTDFYCFLFPKSIPTLPVTHIRNSVPVLLYPSPILFLDLLFLITGLRYPVSNLHYPGPDSPYLSSALFSPALTLFSPTPVLFFPVTDPCYPVTTLRYPESLSPYPIAYPNPLLSAFLCSSLHTCAQRN